jgi:hypothetical protein
MAPRVPWGHPTPRGCSGRRARRGAILFLAAAAAVTTAAARTEADGEDAFTLPPWSSDPLPEWAESVQIVQGDHPLVAFPDAEAPRRGSAMREVRLPLYGARSAPGCAAAWYHVGPQAWVCGDGVELSGGAPIAADRPAFASTVDGLPFDYYFAGQDGSLAYARIEEVDVGEPKMTLEPGFAVAIVEEQEITGHRYGRTNRGLWVPMRDFGPARTLPLQGAVLAPSNEPVIPVAWVVVDHAPIYARNGGSFSPTGASLERFEQVQWLEEKGGMSGSYARIGDTQWIRQKDVRHPTKEPPPPEPEIEWGARWIDIELATQTLVAYEGTTPAFATIVSTGRGQRKGHPFETPKGVHRIWVKLLTTTMDNLEDDNASRYWRIEDVPFVQFFSKGVALHAAFWHRSFGNVRSHGCVNLTPLDARWLFSWTGPRLPSGWTAALPTNHDRGTIVRVR